ncbi:MAG: universal stress protein [Natronomonas sp.]
MTVLIAYDGSKPAQNAVDYAIDEHGDKPMTLLRVVEVPTGATDAGFDYLQGELKERRGETREKIASEISDRLNEADIEFDIQIVFGQPAREIVRFAEENDVEQIIIGNHGRSGVSRVLLGSVAEKVIRRASIPVTVVR